MEFQYAGRLEGANERRLRKVLMNLLMSLQRRRQKPYEATLADNAWIIAPHPDDEVLGCGGTILRKQQHGAEIRVVYLTDGAGSHADVITPAELAQRRKQEALNACRALNVPEEQVFFLDYPDGVLLDSLEKCANDLERLFRKFGGTQFYVPHRMDGPSDHEAARLAVLLALSRSPEPVALPLELVEYSVWCWYHWPWVALAPGGSAPRRLARRIKELIYSWRWLSGCYTSISIADLVDKKRFALEKHVSQVSGLPEAPDAATLTSLRDGEFIKRLLGPAEIFKTSHIRDTRDFGLRLNE